MNCHFSWYLTSFKRLSINWKYWWYSQYKMIECIRHHVILLSFWVFPNCSANFEILLSFLPCCEGLTRFVIIPFSFNNHYRSCILRSQHAAYMIISCLIHVRASIILNMSPVLRSWCMREPGFIVIPRTVGGPSVCGWAYRIYWTLLLHCQISGCDCMRCHNGTTMLS